ncbi:hypothetical protein Tco_0942499 [Tanacetum coccineum]
MGEWCQEHHAGSGKLPLAPSYYVEGIHTLSLASCSVIADLMLILKSSSSSNKQSLFAGLESPYLQDRLIKQTSCVSSTKNKRQETRKIGYGDSRPANSGIRASEVGIKPGVSVCVSSKAIRGVQRFKRNTLCRLQETKPQTPIRMKNQIGIRSVFQKGLGKPKIRFRKKSNRERDTEENRFRNWDYYKRRTNREIMQNVIRERKEKEKRELTGCVTTSKSEEETDCPKLLFEDYREIEEKRGSGSIVQLVCGQRLVGFLVPKEK